MSIPGPKPDVILFDLDGTLVDSLPDIARALNALLADVGRRAVTTDEVHGWVGDGSKALVERALKATGELPGGSLDHLVRRYLDHYRGHAAIATTIYPGVEETLRRLRQAGYRLGVCTNKPGDIAEDLLRALGLADLFSAVVGGESVPRRKPHPDHLLAALDAMDARGARALMVGDGKNDVEAARGAGMPVVVVTFGYAHSDPRQLGADLVIDHFPRLESLLAAMG